LFVGFSLAKVASERGVVLVVVRTKNIGFVTPPSSVWAPGKPGHQPG
jgi:hypothetical protein